MLGGTTAYWVYGPPDAETTIIAVHGFRGEHHGLEPVVAHLDGVRIISPDLPGFGETAPLPGRRHDLSAYSDWLTAFAPAVAPGAVILGHSFGSIVVAAAVAGRTGHTPGHPGQSDRRARAGRTARHPHPSGRVLLLGRRPAAQAGGRRTAAQRGDRAGHERVDGQDAQRRTAPLHPRPARHVLLPLRRPRCAARRVPGIRVARRPRVRSAHRSADTAGGRASATTSPRSRRSVTSPRSSRMPNSSRSPMSGT